MLRIREIPEGYRLTKASVFCKDRYAGTLERTREGAEFTYDAAYLELEEKEAPAIALSIPRSSQPNSISGVNLQPYFANLLPEGWMLQAASSRLKVAKDDLLSLLVAIGLDTIGDTWLDWSREPALPTCKEWDLRTDTFEEILAEQYGVVANWIEPVSIPGVQEKLSANRITITQVRAKGQPAIIKLNLNPQKYPRLVQNEHFFMEMARSCGLNTPRTKIISDAAENEGLWIERFDRKLLPDGTIMRLHQEDICQILELFPADKYNLSARDVGNALRESCPAWKAEILTLIRLNAFSYLIGNGDLHGKNISILESESGFCSLSPAYDLLTTLAYPLDRTMAIPIMGRNAKIKGKTLVEFGRLFEIPEAAIKDLLESLVKRASPFVGRIEQIDFDKKQERFLVTEMETRLKELGDF